MIQWIKQHPLMTGGIALLIVVLFVVLRKSGGSGTVVVGPSDAALGANLAASVQLATLQAQSASHASDLNAAIAGKKIDAATLLAVTGAQKDVALTGILAGADVQTRQSNNTLLATQYQTDAVVQAQRINANRDIAVTGIQADVAKDTTSKQLAAQGLISKATVDVAGIQAKVDMSRTDAALTGLLDTNRTNLSLGLDTNATTSHIADVSSDTAKTLAQLNADTEQLKTKVAGNVYTDWIDSQAKNVSDWISSNLLIQTHQDNIVYGLVSSGQLNKGGEGGANQVAVLDSLLKNFTGSAVASQGASNQGVAGANMLTNITSSIAAAFSKIF